eukprot:6223204-Prymnesium_polylepis.1
MTAGRLLWYALNIAFGVGVSVAGVWYTLQDIAQQVRAAQPHGRAAAPPPLLPHEAFCTRHGGTRATHVLGGAQEL